MIVILGFSAFVPTVSVKTGNASKIRPQIHRQGGAYMPKRGENIYKRKDGRWEGRYIRGRSPSGRAEYGYVYAGSYRECRAKRQKCLDACREAPVAASSLTLNQAAERFLADKQDDLKRSTLARYTYVLKHYILPVFGAVLLSPTDGEPNFRISSSVTEKRSFREERQRRGGVIEVHPEIQRQKAGLPQSGDDCGAASVSTKADRHLLSGRDPAVGTDDHGRTDDNRYRHFADTEHRLASWGAVRPAI